MTLKNIVPVILSGGSGTRLWPMSDQDNPKQFLKLLDDEYSLIQATVERALKVTGAPASRVVTVTLSDLKQKTIEHLMVIDPDLADHVLSEPSGQNTAAAIAFAAQYVSRQFGNDAVMWILPSDHHIGLAPVLRQAVTDALPVCEQDQLVTFGIKPTRAEPGYGYILAHKQHGETKALHVDKFIEKPTLEIAEQFIESDDYLWSSGMHLCKAQAVLDNFKKHAPKILDHVKEALVVGNSAKTPALGPYQGIKKIPFEKAVLEKSESVAVIPTDPQWSDVGSWWSLWEINKKDPKGNVTDGKVACYNTEDSIVLGKHKLIACAGLKDVVIVETDNAILVADKNNSEDMKVLVTALNKMDSAKPDVLSAKSKGQEAA